MIKRKNLKAIKNRKIISAFTLFLSSVVVVFIQIIPLSKKITNRPLGVHWAKGFSNQFYFVIDHSNSFIHSFFETVWFFLRNTALIIENHIAPYNFISSISENTLGLASLTIFAPILFYGFKKLDRKFKAFISFSIITFFLLVLNQKLTLSPTRHTIWVIPFILILIGSLLNSFKTLSSYYKLFYLQYLAIKLFLKLEKQK